MATPEPAGRPTLRQYLMVAAVLVALCLALRALVGRGGGTRVPPEAFVAPMAALIALTALSWLVMVVARNAAVLRGAASTTSFEGPEPLAEWVVRPGRLFNNLMQVPMLFYAASMVAMTVGPSDRAQLSVGWAFVAARGVHALIFLIWNHVPARFTSWVAGCIAVGVLWARLALAHAL